MKTRTHRYLISAALISVVSTVACQTSPLGRKQLLMVPDGQMNQMGATAFNELKQKTPVDSDPAVNAYVRCIALPITQAAHGQVEAGQWEIVVFKDESANAFALPGGKIGVHSGILKVAKTADQLASVLGHEVGHVIAKHGAERMSEGVIANLGMGAVEAFILGGDKGSTSHSMTMAALGLGAQFGVLLPHGRTQESEADLIGLDLMARAGFNPKESVELWKNMAAASKGAPPEFMSTHPSSETRISNLQAHMGEADSKFQQAKAQGSSPQCKR